MHAAKSERKWLELAADMIGATPPELPAERIALQLVRSLDGTGCAISLQGADDAVTGTILSNAWNLWMSKIKRRVVPGRTLPIILNRSSSQARRSRAGSGRYDPCSP